MLGRASRLDGAGSAALVAGIVLFCAFSAGGYFPDTVGVAAAALCLGLALRVAVAAEPFAGWGRSVAVPAGALTLLAAWSLASALWSHSAGRAVIDADRVLLYLLVLAALAAPARSPARLRAGTYGLAASAVVVAVAALASRLAPDVFPTAASVMPERLSFPITYWNGLALLAGVGLVACVHLAADLAERTALRVVAAAAVPGLAVTALLTFSRGGLAVAGLALVAYLLLARPAGAPGALVATVPPAAVALVAAYRAPLLASADPVSSAAAAQGHRVAAALVACTVAAAVLRLVPGRRLDGVRIAWRARVPAVSRRTRRLTLVVVAAAVLAAAGLGAHSQYRRFATGPSAVASADSRNRLTDASGNGRAEYWRAALDAFAGAPLGGTGAGTYQLAWWRHRRAVGTATQAHSLYFETLGELGVVGLGLLAVALAALLAALWRVQRRRELAALGMALAVSATAWMLHAAFDWDWELPAVSAWVVALGAIALAREREPGAPAWRPGLAARAAIAAALVLLAAAPGLLALSENRLARALRSYARGDCAGAVAATQAAEAAMPPRAEPRALLGLCAARAGRWANAVGGMRQAIARDPHDWEYHWGLAIVLAAQGIDPRPEIAAARRLDPLEPTLTDAQAAFGVPDPRTWKGRAQEARPFIDGLDYPPLGG